MLIDRFSVAVCDGLLASTTRTVKLNTPETVGVPLITPPESEMPEGKEPEIKVHVYGAVPPVALKV
jgi:hypothetical protein